MWMNILPTCTCTTRMSHTGGGQERASWNWSQGGCEPLCGWWGHTLVLWKSRKGFNCCAISPASEVNSLFVTLTSAVHQHILPTRSNPVLGVQGEPSQKLPAQEKKLCSSEQRLCSPYLWTYIYKWRGKKALQGRIWVIGQSLTILRFSKVSPPPQIRVSR